MKGGMEWKEEKRQRRAEGEGVKRQKKNVFCVVKLLPQAAAPAARGTPTGTQTSNCIDAWKMSTCCSRQRKIQYKWPSLSTEGENHAYVT
jgi:hypothetical protein